MKEFRFVILGAGNIAGKFCEAVSLIEGAAVVAVASKSLTKAMNFAEKNGVVKAYGDYEEMLQMEKPDGAYIAVTPSFDALPEIRRSRALRKSHVPKQPGGKGGLFSL